MIAILGGRKPVGRLGAKLEAPAGFAPGEAVTVAVNATGELQRAQLHYRHVNQGERWKAMPMSRNGGRYEATIPADYTNSNDHLQVYVTGEQASGVGVAPGFADNLAGAPYLLIPQRA